MPQKRNRKSTKPKISFEKRVVSVLNAQAETKQKVVSLFNNTPILGNGLNGANANGGLYALNILSSMLLANGTNQEERNGNSISNASLTFRGFVESANYNSTTNPNQFPYECHLVFFKNKGGELNESAVPFQKLKSQPGNLNAPVDGTVMNSLYPYNKDLYTIKKVKIFKLKGSPFFQTASGTYTQPYNDGLSTQYRRFKINIAIKKMLKYNDGGTTPTNDWLSVGCFIILGDGSTYTSSQVKANISMDAVLRYDDF